MTASGAKRRRDGTRAAVRSLVVLSTLALPGAAAAETWHGLEVAPEHRCSPYDRKADYPYPQSVEQQIVRGLGAVYGPYRTVRASGTVYCHKGASWCRQR